MTPSIVVYVLLQSALAGPADYALRTRSVALDPVATVDSVDVVVAPGSVATIRFPDSFSDDKVVCGRCRPAESGEMRGENASLAAAGNPKAEAKTLAGDSRLWVLEVSEDTRSIHLRAAKLPDGQNLPAAFTTNINVLLDGGHVVSLTVYMLNIFAQNEAVAADKLVTLTLPESSTFSGKLAEAIAEQDKRADQRVSKEASRRISQRMAGEVRCKALWGAPHVKDYTVVRLRQLCRVDAADLQTFWVNFSVQNRSQGELLLRDAVLTPIFQSQRSAVAHDADIAPFSFSSEGLGYDARVEGVAVSVLKKGSAAPTSWTFAVNPDASDRASVTIDGLTF